MRDLAAAILSAGKSSRMGSPKALLDAGDGETFLERIVSLLRAAEIRRILVVVAPDAGPIRTVAQRANVSCVENPDPAAGPISSIRTALDVVEAEGFEQLLFWPVDMPCVRLPSLQALVQASSGQSLPIVLPAHEGRRGHPVVVSRAVWPELRAPEADLGARVVIRQDPARVLEVPVDDPGVRLDIDTTRAYRRHRFGTRAFRGP